MRILAFHHRKCRKWVSTVWTRLTKWSVECLKRLCQESCLFACERHLFVFMGWPLSRMLLADLPFRMLPAAFEERRWGAKQLCWRGIHEILKQSAAYRWATEGMKRLLVLCLRIIWMECFDVFLRNVVICISWQSGKLALKIWSKKLPIDWHAALRTQNPSTRLTFLCFAYPKTGRKKNCPPSSVNQCCC